MNKFNILHRFRRLAAVTALFCTLSAAFLETGTMTVTAQTANASSSFNIYNNEAATKSGLDALNDKWPQAPEVVSESVILIDADTGAVLYDKNSHAKSYPASTTKILTGLLVLENCSMDETVTFSREAAESVKYGDASLGTRTGEQYTVEQALYGLLLHSANEIAYGLAEHVSGSLNAFVQLMNQRAKELGAVNTHFSNASGLHDSNHYTTAYDMAMIARACYNNTTFVNIDSTYTTYVIPPTNKTSGNRYVRHRHSMLKNRSYYYEYCKGGKTGYTDDAGNTLVTFAEKNGTRLICVCYKSTEEGRYTDTRTLFDWGFAKFSKITATAGEINSLFTNSSYYKSNVYNKFNYVFNITSSTLTLPNNASMGNVSMDINELLGTSYENDIYTANLNYNYFGHTVGSATLTLSSADAFAASSNLPYKSTEQQHSPTPKKPLVINIWSVIGVGILILVIIYTVSEIKRMQRQKYRMMRRKKR